MTDDDEEEDVAYGDGLGAVEERLTMEVVMTDPVVVGHLLGPDGSPIFTLYDRSVVAFGFQPG